MRTDGGYPKGPPREHIRDMSRMVIRPIHRSEGLVGGYPRGHLRDPGVQIWRSSNPEVIKSGGHEIRGHGSRYRYAQTHRTRDQHIRWLPAGIPDPPVRGMRTVVPAWAYGVSVHSGYGAHPDDEDHTPWIYIHESRIGCPDHEIGDPGHEILIEYGQMWGQNWYILRLYRGQTKGSRICHTVA